MLAFGGWMEKTVGMRGSPPGSGALEVAEEMADPRLIEALEVALQNGRDHIASIEAALESCRRPATTE